MEGLEDFLHLRITTYGIDISILVEFLKSELDVVMIVREHPFLSNEHIHSTVKLRTSKSTFRDRLLKAFPSIQGNRSYSMKKVRKWDSNLHYCYKGTASDYPDVLYTIHEWDYIKTVYREYWAIQADVLKAVKARKTPLPVEGETEDLGETVVVKKRTRTLTFTQKLCNDIMNDPDKSVVHTIWHFHGDKQYQPTNTLEWAQDRVIVLLYRRLGEVVKNIDDFILERMMRGIYAHILAGCPTMDLIEKKAVESLKGFRHKLAPVLY